MQLLGARERDVLALAAEGLTDKEIAKSLDIGVATVRTYWDRVRHKLGTGSRAHSVVKGMQLMHDEAVRQEGNRPDLYRYLVDSFTDVAIFFIDLDSKISTWNPAVERVLGYAEEEFIGLSFHELFTQDEVDQGVPEFEMKEAKEKGTIIERRNHVRKDGTIFHSRGRLTRVTDDEDNFVGFAKILGEMTPKK